MTRAMSSASTRRAPPSHGGLARLVSRFENLGASSKSHQDIGAAQAARDHPTLISKSPDASLVQQETRDNAAEASRTVVSPSLAPTGASLATHGRLETSVRDSHIDSTATPSSKVGKLISRRGSAVAEMRRLFERGLDDNAASSE